MKPLKIAIVGCEESSWKQEQAFIAKQTIKNIFLDNLSEYEKRRYPTKKLTSVKLISGHCPRGGVDIWAEKIADELGIQKGFMRLKCTVTATTIGRIRLSIDGTAATQYARNERRLWSKDSAPETFRLQRHATNFTV
ncbi:MAG: hypothetical protein QXZ70_04360 [Candidatus Bathyarchaeia archaeon]